MARRWSPFLPLAAAAAVLLSGCAPTIAGFQEQAYRNGTTVKAESDALFATAATVTYADSTARIDRVAVDLDAGLNYAAGLSRNTISATQWTLLRDGIFRPFLATWKAEGKVSPAAAQEFAGRLDQAFDLIICLEANKRAATACAALNGGKP